jgi:DNA-binding NtrC family response regulator
MENFEILSQSFLNPALEPLMVINREMALRDIERSVILATLKCQRFNRTKTAKVLGIGIRTLQRRLKE